MLDMDRGVIARSREPARDSARRAAICATMRLIVAACITAVAARVTNVSSGGCASSDHNLLVLSRILCSSLVQRDTEWCGIWWRNVTAHRDWANQAVYMLNLVRALYANSTCLDTPFAQSTVRWLDSKYMADPAYTPSNFMATYLVFQVQYYDMPRKPGARIESPDTLGRKCWAFTYLKQFWQPRMLERALATVGLSMPTFITAYNRAIPLTMGLCEAVMANWCVGSNHAIRRSASIRSAALMKPI